MSNILDRARAIVYDRSEEKERQYGPFRESMKRAAAIYNNMAWGANATDIDMYKALIALKLSREGFAHKEDNLLDAIAYMASMNDALEEDARKAKARKENCNAPKSDIEIRIIPTQENFDDACKRALAITNAMGETVCVIAADSEILLESYIDYDNGRCLTTSWYNKASLDKLGINYELK